MTKNKKLDAIISLLIAIGLWLYVFSASGLTASTVIRNIPIELLNVDKLEANGLTILATEVSTVSITYSGQRNSTLGIKESDFKVSVDCEGLSEGETKVRLDVQGPENVSIESVSNQSMRIVIDELVTVQKDIKVVIINDKSDETEPYIVQTSKDKVRVTGAKTLVSTIQNVQAALDATKVTTEMQALSLQLTPINSLGKAISGVELSDSNVSVTTVLLGKKTVQLDVPVTGVELERFTRIVDLPKAITLKGTADDLEEIESIDCEPIDISNLFENTEIALVPITPDNVEVASDSSELKAKVTVSRAKLNTLNFSASDI